MNVPKGYIEELKHKLDKLTLHHDQTFGSVFGDKEYRKAKKAEIFLEDFKKGKIELTDAEIVNSIYDASTPFPPDNFRIIKALEGYRELRKINQNVARKKK